MDGFKGPWWRPKNLALCVLFALGIALLWLRRQSDRLLDWWEFKACRAINNHPLRAMALVTALGVLLIFAVVIWFSGPARAQSGDFIIVPTSLIERAIERIESLEAENARLRRQCPPGAVSI